MKFDVTCWSACGYPGHQ